MSETAIGAVTVQPAEEAALARAVAFLGDLILPSGRRMGDSFRTDDWLLTEIVHPCLRRQADGTPANRYAYFELPKGVGKSTMAGALSFVECVMYPGTQAFVVACDVEQGAIIIDVLRELVSRFPRLKAVVRQRGNEFRLSNGSFVRVQSSDVPSSHGLGATAKRLLFVLDEWTQHVNPGMYHSMLSTMGKIVGSAMWIFCNAGIQNSWQQSARDQLQAAGAHMFVAPEGWLPSWVSREDVEALRLTLPQPLWLRYYGNRWISELGVGIGPMEWDACQAAIPALDARTAVVVGVDAATGGEFGAGDTFAIVAVSPERSEPRPEWAGGTVYEWPASRFTYYSTHGFTLMQAPKRPEPPKLWVRAVACWEPKGGPIDFREPYRWLSEFVRGHKVVVCCYDRYQLHSWASDFQLEHGIWMEDFSQQGRRAQADVDLLRLIRERRVLHDGDELLRSHALNAQLKVSADGRARFVKAHPSRKIDSVVALSMATSRALSLNLETL